MSSFDRELEVCLEAIGVAGSELMVRYAAFEKIADAPADITTEADRVSQEIILNRLANAFPKDGLCGEESTPTVSQSVAGAQRLWIVDPIDGTRGFARKNDEFSIMIALVESGQPVVGAVYEPAIDRLTYAVKGQGCFVRSGSASDSPEPCHVSTTRSLLTTVLSISRSQGSKGEAHLLEAFGAARAIQTYSAGIKLAQVARGETDMYLGDYLTLKDWDVCAGHLLVEEAGGKVTNIEGDRIAYRGTGGSLEGKGILATNSALHQAALDILAAGKVRFDA